MSEKEKLLGITLIDEEEEFEFKPYPQTKPEVKIIYRRISESEQGLVRMKHTKDDRNGKTDDEAVGIEVLKYGLVRFEHVYTRGGELASCTVENLRKLDAWLVERMIFIICGRAAGYVHVPLSSTPGSSQNSK